MVRYQIDPKIKVKKVDDLLDAPHTIVVNKFDEDAVKSFRLQFQAAVNSGQPVIPIVIDSYGGQVYSLMSMIGIIKASPVPVATIGMGKCCSCGSLLLAAGNEGMRFMDPFATVMIHDVSSGAFGKVEDLKADVKEAERLNQWVFKVMAQNCGKPDDYFLKLIESYHHANAFLCADECKKHNIVNHIRVPQFTVKVETSINFG